LPVQLFSKISNLCDHKSPTSHADRWTDRRTTCDRKTALCIKVYCAVSSSHECALTVLRLLPRDATQNAVFPWQVVRLSVCPSVTLRYRGHTGWNTPKIISYVISLGYLLTADLNVVNLLQREHLQNGRINVLENFLLLFYTGCKLTQQPTTRS